MKKILVLLVVSLICLLSSCGNNYIETSSQQTELETIVSSNIEIVQSDVSSKNKTSSKTNFSSDNIKNNVSEKQDLTVHKHSYTTEVFSATCQKQGYTKYTCSCGDTYNDNYTNGSHNFVNNKCEYCNIADVNGLYSFLKKWVTENGRVYGDYVSFSKSADNYGGYSSENFSLYYWADTEKIEFCLHSVIDEEFSINFYIYVPETFSGKYDYITSYYYRDT